MMKTFFGFPAAVFFLVWVMPCPASALSDDNNPGVDVAQTNADPKKKVGRVDMVPGIATTAGCRPDEHTSTSFFSLSCEATECNEDGVPVSGTLPLLEGNVRFELPMFMHVKDELVIESSSVVDITNLFFVVHREGTLIIRAPAVRISRDDEAFTSPLFDVSGTVIFEARGPMQPLLDGSLRDEGGVVRVEDDAAVFLSHQDIVRYPSDNAITVSRMTDQQVEEDLASPHGGKVDLRPELKASLEAFHATVNADPSAPSSTSSSSPSPFSSTTSSPSLSSSPFSYPSSSLASTTSSPSPFSPSPFSPSPFSPSPSSSAFSSEVVDGEGETIISTVTLCFDALGGPVDDDHDGDVDGSKDTPEPKHASSTATVPRPPPSTASERPDGSTTPSDDKNNDSDDHRHCHDIDTSNRVYTGLAKVTSTTDQASSTTTVPSSPPSANERSHGSTALSYYNNDRNHHLHHHRHYRHRHDIETSTKVRETDAEQRAPRPATAAAAAAAPVAVVSAAEVSRAERVLRGRRVLDEVRQKAGMSPVAPETGGKGAGGWVSWRRTPHHHHHHHQDVARVGGAVGQAEVALDKEEGVDATVDGTSVGAGSDRHLRELERVNNRFPWGWSKSTKGTGVTAKAGGVGAKSGARTIWGIPSNDRVA